ncbi:hypothetical protein F4776DRAFT_361991 [Hypoxylon sp. NC0597]|nr:hypothetical protein F4776DRAFT_361991 [Hypoxylon sp. NC0597]
MGRHIQGRPTRSRIHVYICTYLCMYACYFQKPRCLRLQYREALVTSKPEQALPTVKCYSVAVVAPLARYGHWRFRSQIIRYSNGALIPRNQRVSRKNMDKTGEFYQLRTSLDRRRYRPRAMLIQMSRFGLDVRSDRRLRYFVTIPRLRLPANGIRDHRRIPNQSVPAMKLRYGITPCNAQIAKIHSLDSCIRRNLR